MNPNLRHIFLPLLLVISVLVSCKDKTQHTSSLMEGAFTTNEVEAGDDYDLESIRNSGELIVATISGPETYYDYRGQEMGLQYALVQHFAETEGVSVRVELAKDTTELIHLLQEGDVDVVAYPLSQSYVDEMAMTAAGYNHAGTWAVRDNARALAKALDDWFHEGLISEVQDAEKERLKQSRHVTRRAQAVYLSRDRGVISVYDHLFKNASGITGWDWKLIAAQCYQESTFDPNARSYVGAQGLMQLMPGTARELGLNSTEVWQPDKNVDAAARYIVRLSSTFSDIRDPQERIKFVLASYNGGARHVQDAQALARKYGKDPARWDDVAPFILGLQHARFYRDPVVKYGYMIGSETVDYVQSILERWRDYGGRVAVTHAPRLPQVLPGSTNTSAAAPSTSSSTSSSTPQGTEGGSHPSASPVHRNRFSSGLKVKRPDDPSFNQMEE